MVCKAVTPPSSPTRWCSWQVRTSRRCVSRPARSSSPRSIRQRAGSALPAKPGRAVWRCHWPLSVVGDESAFPCHVSRLSAVCDAELGEQVGDVHAGCLFGDEKGLAYLAIGEAL